MTTSTNSAPSSSDEEIYSHVLDMAQAVLDSGSFDIQGLTAEEYIASVKRVLHGQIYNLRAPYTEWRKSAAPYERRTQQRLRMLVWLFGAMAFTVIVNIVEVGITQIDLLGRFSKIISSHVAGINLFFILVTASVWAIKGPHRTSSQSSKTSYLLDDQFSDLVRDLILQPAVSAAFEIQWLDSSVDEVRVQDGTSLSSKADRQHIVATSAYNRVSVALTRRNGCSIGVAGPRGCGKTELARTFTDFHGSDSRNRTIPLFLWAPSEDDANTFMLRMLKELCINIISIASGDSDRNEPAARIAKRRRWLATALVAITLVGLGTAVLATDLTGGNLRTMTPIITGSTLIWAGLGSCLWVLVSQPRRSALIDIRQSTLELAAALRSRVDFTETLKTNSQVGISAYGLNLTTGSGAELVRAPLNTIDVIREIRGLVQAISRDGWQVIIAIDEMDKMPSQEAAARFLNHIKVLFPIAGCSFIISVSEMAWSLFERRGMPLRDVLDSSFDEIINLDVLSAAESRDILKRRDRTISDPQALLCHCLSGGLPRDLLRWARILARTAAENSPPSALGFPRLDEVLDPLLESELNTKIQAIESDIPNNHSSASLRTEEGDRSWLAIWPDHDEIERDLIKSWSGLQQGSKTDSMGNASEVLVYIAILHTIRQAFTAGGQLSRLDDNEGFDYHLIRNGFEGIAHARSKLSRNAVESWLLLKRARAVLGLKPLEYEPAHPN